MFKRFYMHSLSSLRIRSRRSSFVVCLMIIRACFSLRFVFFFFISLVQLVVVYVGVSFSTILICIYIYIYVCTQQQKWRDKTSQPESCHVCLSYIQTECKSVSRRCEYSMNVWVNTVYTDWYRDVMKSSFVALSVNVS